MVMDSPGASTAATATTIGSSSGKKKNNNNKHNKHNKTTKQSFRPFVNATTETPLCHMILAPTMLGGGGGSSSSSIISQLYRCRWFLSTPFRINLVPKWIMMMMIRSINVCGGGWTIKTPTLTIGEVLLGVVPLLLLTVQGYHYSIMVPNTSTSGELASYLIFITYATANKSNSIFSILFGIPFERLIYWHHMSSLLALLVTILHIYTSYRFTDDSEYANVSMVPFLVDNTINITGLIATSGLMVLIVSSAFSRVVRHYVYQSWLVLHIVSAISVLVGLILHHVTIAIFIALWWTLDLVIVRYLIQANCTHKCTTATLRLIDDQRRTADHHRRAQPYEPSVEISIDNRHHRYVQFTAGQYARIAVPAINRWEYHPLSISSAPHEDKLTFHVRNLGDWTAQLVALADNNTTNATTTTVLLEGPYGAPSIDYDDDRHYRYVLLIGGGIGITPLQSIGKNLLYQRAAQNRKLQFLRYVWAVRNLQIVDDIPPLGRSSSPSDDDIDDNDKVVQVDVYCTRTSSSSTPEEDAESSSDDPRRPYHVHVGRPDLNAIFAEMKAQVMDDWSSSKNKRHYSSGREASVAVIACGPAQMLHDVERLCRLYSPSIVDCASGGGGGGAGGRGGVDGDDDVAVYFDLHQEHFEF